MASMIYMTRIPNSFTRYPPTQTRRKTRFRLNSSDPFLHKRHLPTRITTIKCHSKCTDHDHAHVHNHHHLHHCHHHHHNGQLTKSQQAFANFAKAIKWSEVADFLREHFELCCFSTALFLASAFCPYVVAKAYVKHVQQVLSLVAFPIVGGCKFNGKWASIVGSSNYLHSKNIIPLNTLRFRVCCGTRIRFWKDIWIGDSPLYTRYNRLFRLDPDKDCLIIDRIANGQWNWNWSREDIGVRNKAYLRDLLLEISLVDPNVEEDSCVWEMANDGIFSVGDTRRLIDSKILSTLVPSTSWDKTLPRKVNIFIWRLALDWLPHRLNLSARGMDIPSISCSLCNGNVESSSHIFFDCDFAKEVWRLVRIWCDIPLPTFTSYGHWMSWFTSWQAPKEKLRRLSIIVAASFWWIWRFRNIVVFCPHPLRKSDMFDNIRSASFSWLFYRGRMGDWLKAPLLIAC
ncbi:RNA-directed DNA polymerase, eukaryota, reverse transcriptase zinc-binding domain protein [Tanacetum coccineum]